MPGPVTHRYRVGDAVTTPCGEGRIERTGISINGLPLYLVGGRWWKERDVGPAMPPCPR